MTDRIRTLTVILDRDMRDDDAMAVIEAIGMTRFVESVELGPVVGHGDVIRRRVFALDQGKLISELALGRDQGFNDAVRAAYAVLEQRRGF